MRITICIFFLGIFSISFSQQNEKVSTVEFVQILNDNKEEAIYYYQNNWKILREMAMEKEYIHSYQVLETQSSEPEPFQLVLITTYLTKEQYNLRELHFGELIRLKGPVKLMNNKKPEEFRKITFSTEMVKSWN
jgi:hypothetical protein